MKKLLAEDVVALAFAALALMWSLLLGAYVAPKFAELFSEFGSTLPGLTAVFLETGPRTLVALVPLALVLSAVLGGAGKKLRVGVMLFCIVWAFAQPALLLAAIYLPLFNLAGAVSN